MAESESFSDTEPPSIGCYETALCIMPPAHLTEDINRLRALYDKAYGKWPPHINLVYPFAAVEDLPRAMEMIRLKLINSGYHKLHVCLDTPDYFSHRRSTTVYITESETNIQSPLFHLRNNILEAANQRRDAYRLHLTIGQSDAHDLLLQEYLLARAASLKPVEWYVEELFVLIREPALSQSIASSRMNIWGTLKLSGDSALALSDPHRIDKAIRLENGSSSPEDKPATIAAASVQARTTFQFSGTDGIWGPIQSSLHSEERVTRTSLAVSSYNVWVDSVDPPISDCYDVLLQSLRSQSALADILVLQEVSDDSICHLLRDEVIRSHYPFTTHGPPSQKNIGPLPSLRKIVVLSRFRFSWESLPFETRYEGAVVLKFDTVGLLNDSTFLPLIVAGVHLSSELTSSSIAAKQSQIKTLLQHLSGSYPDNQWIVAGGFNIPTSTYTIDTAVKRKSIAPVDASTISSLEPMLASAGLWDSWFAARAISGDIPGAYRGELGFGDLYEGEEGATVDPTKNRIAAEIYGQSYHSRPQRYDRIFIKRDLAKVTNFNMFGFPAGHSHQAEPLIRQRGSGHWGVRVLLQSEPNPTASPVHQSSMQIEKASANIAALVNFKSFLHENHAFPTEEEVVRRKDVFLRVKEIVNSYSEGANPSFVVVLVGSYRLGVWSTSSNVDCLCIGKISPKIFFALMTQRVRKRQYADVSILRKMKVSSGMMMELEARGIRLNLHYCAATSVVENWPQVLDLPPSDPGFDLPMQSLIRLNYLRDLEYLQRTIPDLAAFRLAHRFIKIWAKQRGIYSSKLGYLGDIHITLLLSRICKLSFQQSGLVTVSDLIRTFFNFYAYFDWKMDVIYDPTFYKEPPRYYRSSAREPMVILGVHVPKVNVAHAVSLPSLEILKHEFSRADSLLAKDSISWAELAGTTTGASGADEFLKTFNSYVKIDVQYWGMVAKGKRLVAQLESQYALLLVDINRKFPDLHARVWPARFTKMEDIDEDDSEYQGSYLISLTKGDSSTTTNDAERQSAVVSLRSVLDRFAEKFRSNAHYFDPNWSWAEVSLVKQETLQGLRIDDRDWSSAFVDEQPDSEDESEFKSEDEVAVTKPAPISSMHIDNPPPSPTRLTGTKLRPAGDIINRIRWDTSFDTSDYIIGYDDRFLGIREIPFERWKAEQTDEEFIPMHRILYFRRESDRETVWDREMRLDRIFGSGNIEIRM